MEWYKRRTVLLKNAHSFPVGVKGFRVLEGDAVRWLSELMEKISRNTYTINLHVYRVGWLHRLF